MHKKCQRKWYKIKVALAACDGKISGDKGAAKLLGIKPTTLTSRIKKLGLEDA